MLITVSCVILPTNANLFPSNCMVALVESRVRVDLTDDDWCLATLSYGCSRPAGQKVLQCYDHP